VRTSRLFKWKGNLVILGLVLLTGCGTATTPPAPVGPGAGGVGTPFRTPTPTSTPSYPPRATPPPIDEQNDIYFQVDGLDIDAGQGIQCPRVPIVPASSIPYTIYSPHLIPQWMAPDNELVLATNQLSYQSSQVQEMKHFAQVFYDEFNDALPPPELMWVPGASLAQTSAGCSVPLGITNTTSQSIEISQAGITLSAAPAQNPYQYRLINICSLLPAASLKPGQSCVIGAGQGGGPGDCSAYAATIQLSNQRAETVFSQPLTGVLVDQDGFCPEMTLGPGETLFLWLFLTSGGQPANLIYSVVPQLTLDMPGGPKTLQLSQLATSLVFAEPSQFSCYTLQGQTFVQAPNAQTVDADRWCI
jgi:hypothetical protein